MNNFGLNLISVRVNTFGEVDHWCHVRGASRPCELELAAAARRSGHSGQWFVVSASEFPVYKPSVFYFRKALDESRTTAAAIKVALIVCAEFEYLRQWSMERGVLPTVEIMASMDCLRRAIREERSHGQVVVLGLYLCHELEQLKAAVREAGLQPPKWIVAPEEAAAKGWEDRSDLAMDF